MTNSTTVTVRVNADLKRKLESLARSTKRSKSYLAAKALEAYVQNNAWQVDLINQRVKEADAGGPFVEHERVSKWLEALAAGRQAPRPRANRRRTQRGD